MNLYQEEMDVAFVHRRGIKKSNWGIVKLLKASLHMDKYLSLQVDISQKLS